MKDSGVSLWVFLFICLLLLCFFNRICTNGLRLKKKKQQHARISLCVCIYIHIEEVHSKPLQVF